MLLTSLGKDEAFNNKMIAELAAHPDYHARLSLVAEAVEAGMDQSEVLPTKQHAIPPTPHTPHAHTCIRTYMHTIIHRFDQH